MNAHSSFTGNSQKLELVQMSFNKSPIKQTVVYPHQGILLSNENEWIIDTVSNLDGFQEHYDEW